MARPSHSGLPFLVRRSDRGKFNRRLAQDWENPASTLTAFVSLASIQLGLRRLTRQQAFE